MGGLAMVAIWILVRLLFEGKNENGGLTSLNLSNVESDLESGNSSYEAVARPEPSVDTSFDEFFETYYKNRWSTNDILSFLRIFLTTTCYSAPEGSVEMATYFFARISKDRAELVSLYENELSEVGGKGAELLIEILRQAGGSGTREFLEGCVRDDNYSGIRRSLTKALELPFPQFQSALLRPIRTGLDLDLLWCEFLATGSTEPVFRIIDVLNWPDLVRAGLQEWRQTPESRLRRWQAFRRIRKLPETFELRFDGARISTAEDLDCRLGLDGIQTNRQRTEKIRALLPVQFSADELNYIALKSVAKWSIASNAIKHPPVLKACREAEARTTGAGLSLLEIQAEAHLAKWEITQAQKVLDEYLRTSPGNRSLARKRAAAADGVVAIPGGELRTFPLLNRPGTYAAAFIGVFLFAFGDLSFAAVDDLVKSSFWITTISGIVSLLLAIGIGALRQLYNGLLERAVAVPTDRGPIYVGIVPPKFWFDVRAHGASWLLVGALSVWASWGLACGVFRSHSREEFLLWANLVLLVRFGISVGLTRAYFAFRHSRQEKR